MKGSIIDLFLRPPPGPPARRARLPRVPTLRKGKRGLCAAQAGRLAPSRRESGRRRRSRSGFPRRQGRGPTACGVVAEALRCPSWRAHGPGCRRSPRWPLRPLETGARSQAPRSEARPFWTPRFALNTQEMHGLTCEVELLVPSLWSQGERLAEAAGAQAGGRRPRAGQAGAGGGLPPRHPLYLLRRQPAQWREGNFRTSTPGLGGPLTR